MPKAFEGCHAQVETRGKSTIFGTQHLYAATDGFLAWLPVKYCNKLLHFLLHSTSIQYNTYPMSTYVHPACGSIQKFGNDCDAIFEFKT